ncbi:UrcA family protein [Sphingomonas sp. YR710]|jgi:UrcA family protein|uniref:UrcA family protein n=1 Tax=Sphingomonas sp. YR710 TaxID=1882773 RepID=UPI000891F880|nr:UrcA family protein [Sphingomonas sp. YR710]SDD53539.1 UrcA family protein [Sphingomonas sp. YR710]
MKNPIVISSLIVVAFSMSAMATPVIASSDASVTVRYKDLNLANSEGVRELRARVNHAAATVCAGELSSVCVRGAIASAEPQINLALAGGASHSKTETIAVSAH